MADTSTVTIDRRSAAEHASAARFGDAIDIDYLPISADSHVTEPPNCYLDHIDPKYWDVAPRVERGPNGGDLFVVEGMALKIPMGAMAAAGIDPREIRLDESTFADLHPGGFDGKARVGEQDADGIGGEIIYPSVGMLICNHPDADYKSACFTAYNRWLQEFQSASPSRIYGIGQTAVRSVAEAVDDFQRIREMGFHGVMMPCEPATEFDYDDPAFDPLWRAAVELKLPLSFHILTSNQDKSVAVAMGASGTSKRLTSKANTFQALIRANQDVISTFIWGRVFDRFPELKIVCVEADAGWAPHFMYRMDHFYNRHRYWAKMEELPRLPSEYFRENVYMTFQDDYIAFNTTDMMNPDRLMWANDFPHSDSTWPWSRQILQRQTAKLDDQQRRRILRDNVVELYDLPVAS